MAALLVDTETLDFVRELIIDCKHDMAVAALDQLTARSPRSEATQATPKQRWFLSTITGPQGPNWKVMLLPMADAKVVISGLLDEGEVVYKGETYRMCETFKSKQHKRQARSVIPF